MSIWTSVKTAAEPIRNAFAPIGAFFSRTISVWMALLGVLLIVLSAMNPLGLSDRFVKIFDSVGSAVLVGGVFGVLLKSLQYSYFFRKELSNLLYGQTPVEDSRDLITVFRNEFGTLIYGSEQSMQQQNVVSALTDAFQGLMYEARFLKNRRDLIEVWRSISEVVYNTRYPEISGMMAKKITEEYFPTDDNFYYEEYTENISLDLDQARTEYVVSTETIILTVKPLFGCCDEIVWRYETILYKKATDTEDTKFVLNQVKLNGATVVPDYKLTPTADGKSLVASIAIKLDGTQTSKLRLNLTLTYELELNHERDLRSSRFIKTPELRVSYPRSINVDFVPVGTRSDAYEPKGRDLSGVIWNVYKDLIFPNQGYRLVLTRR